MSHQDHLTVNSDLTVLNSVQKWFEKFWLRHHSSIARRDPQLYRLNLALAEGFTNAVRHAHSGLSRDTSIEIQVTMDDDRMEIRIWDWGHHLTPIILKNPNQERCEKVAMAGFCCDG